jgi:hypothetical protein
VLFIGGAILFALYTIHGVPVWGWVVIGACITLARLMTRDW